MPTGFVYKLSGGGKFYIGSTTLTPELRLAEHRSFSTKPASQRQPVYRHFTSIGWETVIVETLRQCEYTTKADLLQHEREEFDKVAADPQCLNVNRPLITAEELKHRVKETAAKWHQDHADLCRERLREWRTNNPEKVKEQRERRAGKAREEHQEWYQQNKDHKREQVRAWRLANPEKYTEQKKRSAQRQCEKRRQASEAKKNLE